ncbi:hypothetical protein BH09ACT1_BH09ACT1_10540 [soil metagenome]
MRSHTIASVPAGWYSDPLGMPQLRWWNGDSWTMNVSEPRTELLFSAN